MKAYFSKTKEPEESKQENPVLDITVAAGFFNRLVGLMFKKEIHPERGLLFESCKSVHTFFMRFPLDVIFLDRNNKIVHITRNLNPFHFTPFMAEAEKVLEIVAGKSDNLGLKKGMTLNLFL